MPYLERQLAERVRHPGLLWLLLALWLVMGCELEESELPPPTPPWPEWAFQHWVWEDEGTEQSALQLVEDYLKNDIPVGAIIIDSPWATGYNTFEFDSALYPDPAGMINALQAKGVRVMLWVVPAINTDVSDLHAHGSQNGYFMQQSAVGGAAVVDWWKGEGSLIDYFNPNGLTWWHSLVDKALDLNIDGWKCDGLDFSVLLAPYSPGKGGEVDRVDYAEAYYRDFFDYTRDRLGSDRIITARSVDNYGANVGGDFVSFAPRDINWAGWVGDQDGNFTGLIAALNNMYHSSKEGYVAFGSDIGGYREIDSETNGRTTDLFIRWAQLGALNPVMENGGGGEHRPWKFEEKATNQVGETVDIYRRFAKLHHALLPYLMEHGARAFEKGESLMTFLDDVAYRYLLGPDILVAPMIASGTSKAVKFPEGDDWVYLFERSVTYKGGATIELDIPYEEYPVFLRKGSKTETDEELRQAMDQAIGSIPTG
jgi:alpha-glucosidase (family GH31 glycosyl hydrolase)